jgi:uncharacterized YccA/Bax inhibitor family protein
MAIAVKSTRMAETETAMAFNPAFGKNAFAPAPPPAPTAAQQQQNMTAQQLQELYSQPAATPVETERMSYDDVIMKTGIALGIVLVGAVIGWFFPAVGLVGALVGLVLAFVNIFKRTPSAPLVLAYAFFEGLFVGAMSYLVEVGFNLPGIALQAVLGTALVFGVTLALFRSGKVRESKRATKVFIIAGIAYAAFSVVNLVLMLTGVNNDPWGAFSADIPGTNIPIGVVIGPLVILMAAYSLVMDFTDIKRGVDAGAPRNYAWRAVFGLVLTIVWLYLEILRLISLVRQ